MSARALKKIENDEEDEKPPASQPAEEDDGNNRSSFRGTMPTDILKRIVEYQPHRKTWTNLRLSCKDVWEESADVQKATPWGDSTLLIQDDMSCCSQFVWSLDQQWLYNIEGLDNKNGPYSVILALRIWNSRYGLDRDASCLDVDPTRYYGQGAMSSDGRWLALFSHRGSKIRIHEIKGGQPFDRNSFFELEGGDVFIRSSKVHFSPDNRHLVNLQARDDERYTFLVWDLVERRLIKQVDVPESSEGLSAIVWRVSSNSSSIIWQSETTLALQIIQDATNKEVTSTVREIGRFDQPFSELLVNPVRNNILAWCTLDDDARSRYYGLLLLDDSLSIPRASYYGPFPMQQEPNRILGGTVYNSLKWLPHGRHLAVRTGQHTSIRTVAVVLQNGQEDQKPIPLIPHRTLTSMVLKANMLVKAKGESILWFCFSPDGTNMILRVREDDAEETTTRLVSAFGADGVKPYGR